MSVRTATPMKSHDESSIIANSLLTSILQVTTKPLILLCLGHAIHSAFNAAKNDGIDQKAAPCLASGQGALWLTGPGVNQRFAD
jgi:hypothetical protein